MARPRQELQDLLVEILGLPNVYFQPPANVSMTYPCIVYNRDSINTKFADDKPYSQTKRYQITYIDKDPDSDVPDKISALPLSSFNQHFVTDNLNHDVYSLYF